MVEISVVLCSPSPVGAPHPLSTVMGWHPRRSSHGDRPGPEVVRDFRPMHWCNAIVRRTVSSRLWMRFAGSEIASTQYGNGALGGEFDLGGALGGRVERLNDVGPDATAAGDVVVASRRFADGGTLLTVDRGPSAPRTCARADGHRPDGPYSPMSSGRRAASWHSSMTDLSRRSRHQGRIPRSHLRCFAVEIVDRLL